MVEVLKGERLKKIGVKVLEEEKEEEDLGHIDRCVSWRGVSQHVYGAVLCPGRETDDGTACVCTGKGGGVETGKAPLTTPLLYVAAFVGGDAAGV